MTRSLRHRKARSAAGNALREGRAPGLSALCAFVGVNRLNSYLSDYVRIPGDFPEFVECAERRNKFAILAEVWQGTMAAVSLDFIRCLSDS